jgi:glycosyltransferase involved in cell wall biosynthesis
MKLICFHLFNDYSGSPKVLKNLLCNLQAQGVEMELITSRGGILDEIPHSPNFKRRSYSYRFSNHAIIATIKYFAAQVYTFFVALGYAFKKDTVFYINTILPVGPAIAGRLTGKKVIDHYHENAMVKSAFYRALAWIMQKIASEIICVSEYQRSFLKRETGVSVVPNAIEESFINKLQPAPEKSFERKTVLMLGSLKRYKGTLEFVELARRLPQYKFELVLNERKENIVTFWQENSIVNTENLVVHARHDDVSIFYNRASVVLNLSNKDLVV